MKISLLPSLKLKPLCTNINLQNNNL
jgi:hypothetical protein